MAYRLLADITVWFHFFWILFLIFGGYWGLRNRRIRVVHVAALLFAFFIGVFGLYCPLTYLEIWLRSQHHPYTSYTGSFIAHYLEKLIYIDLPDGVVGILTAGLCVLYAWLYAYKSYRLDKKT